MVERKTFPFSLEQAVLLHGYRPGDRTYELLLSAFNAGVRQGVFDVTGHALRATGSQLIAVERHRQIDSEGWTPEHDDKHDGGELSAAASAYALLACDIMADYETYENCVLSRLNSAWPWEEEWWKPSPDPIRNLVKAGALLAAEIDRLQRKEKNSGTSE